MYMTKLGMYRTEADRRGEYVDVLVIVSLVIDIVIAEISTIFYVSNLQILGNNGSSKSTSGKGHIR